MPLARDARRRGLVVGAALAVERTLRRVGIGLLQDRLSPVRRDVGHDAGGVLARYVRVVAKTIGVCPPWHKAAGARAWLFADEILIESEPVRR